MKHATTVLLAAAALLPAGCCCIAQQQMQPHQHISFSLAKGQSHTITLDAPCGSRYAWFALGGKAVTAVSATVRHLPQGKAEVTFSYDADSPFQSLRHADYYLFHTRAELGKYLIISSQLPSEQEMEAERATIRRVSVSITLNPSKES